MKLLTAWIIDKVENTTWDEQVISADKYIRVVCLLLLAVCVIGFILATGGCR